MSTPTDRHGVTMPDDERAEAVQEVLEDFGPAVEVAAWWLGTTLAHDRQYPGSLDQDAKALIELRDALILHFPPDGGLVLQPGDTLVLTAVGLGPPAVTPKDHDFVPDVDQGGDPDPTTCNVCGEGREGHLQDEEEEEEPDGPAWIVCLEPGVWLAPWEGDPGRTLVQASAKTFAKAVEALAALQAARAFRPFARAKVELVALADREEG